MSVTSINVCFSILLKIVIVGVITYLLGAYLVWDFTNPADWPMVGRFIWLAVTAYFAFLWTVVEL